MPADPTLTMAAACRDLVQVYDSGAGPVHALRGISADFPAHTMTAIVGPSGAGKSTFLRTLACLERPTVGEVVIAGVSTSQLSGRARRRLVAREIGYVFQSPAENLLDYLSVTEHVSLAWRMRAPEPPGAVQELLATVGIETRATTRPAGLSAGEQQRLAFAMAVAANPALVIADEPTSSLDPSGAAELIAILPALVEAGQTLVICTHDPPVIEAADQVLMLRAGTLATEAVKGQEPLAVLDEASRVHLPAELGDLFPDRRARISRHDDHLRIERP